MTSSTSLYSSTPGNANVASQNFTTLYSGSGAINPTQAYGNANVVSLLAVGTDGGNTIGNIIASGNVTADYFIGNFQGNISGNINVTGSNTQVLFNNAGNVGTAAGFTFVNTTGNLSVPGNVSAVGNVTGTYILGNGSQLTGLPATYSNANVVSLLASFGSNTVSTTGNVSAGYFIGNGSQLTGLSSGYSNANVAAFMAAFGSNTISSTGNITTTANIAGGFILGNGSQLTGLPATYSNANVTSLLASFGSNSISTTGNVTASYFVGNGSLLTALTGANVTGTVANATYALTANAATFATNAVQANVANVANSVAGANVTGTVPLAQFVTGNAQANITSVGVLSALSVIGNTNTTGTLFHNSFFTPAVVALGNITTTAIISAGGNVTGGNITTAGQVSATGNVTGNFFIGNGSQLTGIVSSYGNANVAANLAAFATNPISTSGNITAGYFFGNGSQLTGINAGNIVGAYGNANVADFLGNGFGSNTITTTGNITTGNLLTGGQVSATGNITGGNIRSAVFQAVNSAGGALRNATGTNQLQWGAGGGDNLSLDVSTNINGANAQINISPTGNSGHVHIKPTGTPSVEIAPTFTGSMNNMIIGNVTPAAVSATTVSASGNIDGGNLRTAGLITATGNVTGGNLITAGLATVSGNVTGGNLITAGLVSATGNINGANIVASANLTSTQQTIIGTANVGTTSNIVISGKNIATDMVFAPNGATGTALYNGRISIGTGFNGNTSFGGGTRVSVMDTIVRSNTGTNIRAIDIDTQISLTGNVTNGSFRQQGLGSRMRVGGGSAGNSINLAGGGGQNNALAALQPNLDVGNVSPYFLGNTTVSHSTLNGGFFTTFPGGNFGNAYGMLPGLLAQSDGNAAAVGNITNYIGFTTNMGASPSVVGNLYGFYHPNVAGSSEASATAIGVANAARLAANYYAFRNDDPVAQVKLGSLRTYHEYQYSTATTGTVNIDKNNSQVQLIAPTANVTIGDFQNFVTTASNSVSNLNQADTVTLIIKQGATPYTVTMPTGNAAIKYAGNVTTVGSTANAVTMVSITGANVAGAALYLVTVSPEFV
jgi:hypothetical protein